MKTYEQLKNYHFPDFIAPQKVLCYGAGEMGKWMIEPYLRSGIHVVGFIDNSKKGKLILL